MLNLVHNPILEMVSGLRFYGSVMIRELTFTFHYEEPDYTLPTAIGILPNPDSLHDNIILMMTATFTRVLSNRHGLEQALKMVEDAGYGKIGDARLIMKWEEREDTQELSEDS